MKFSRGPVLSGKHWRDLKCYCEEAVVALNGADVICASCACNRRKQEKHFIAYKFSNGNLCFVDIIGPPLIPKIIDYKIHRTWLSNEERRFDRFLCSPPRSLTDERPKRD